MKKMKGGIIATIFLVSLLAVINPVSATDWHVYSGQSIQTTITNANPGDTIYVHAGTYNESLTISKNLTLIGDGASVTTIASGGGSTVLVNAPATVNISGFTIMNEWIGIWYFNGSSGTIAHNIVTDPTPGSFNASGIIVDASSPTIEYNTVTGNYDNIRFYTGSTSTVQFNTITGSTMGSGISVANSSPTITNNTITGNYMYGIYNNVGASSTITNNVITGNGLLPLPGTSKGGIANWNTCSPTITNNTITGNLGYGIDNNMGASPTVINNIVAGNTFDGVYSIGSFPTVYHNTIVGNRSGVVSIMGSNATVINNIVAFNTQFGFNVSNATCTHTYNTVWMNSGGDYFGTVVYDPTEILADPQLDGTYHLSNTSPCIDAGINVGVSDDFDGDARPFGAGFDIGADEYVSPVSANPIAAFIPVKNYHLAQMNAYLGCIEENLPEEVPDDIQELLDEIQEHIDNANTTGNTIYANNELLKALELCGEIQEKLGIMCS